MRILYSSLENLSHPAMLLLLAGSSFLRGPLELTPQLLPTQNAPLPSLFENQGIGSQLSPFHFQSIDSRQVSCYALFNGWLLLSLPPCCLRVYTPSSLSWHFGTLTLGWVVSLSDTELTPVPPLHPSSALANSEFDRTAEPFGP
jgi:hypothetical protein